MEGKKEKLVMSEKLKENIAHANSQQGHKCETLRVSSSLAIGRGSVPMVKSSAISVD